MIETDAPDAPDAPDAGIMVDPLWALLIKNIGLLFDFGNIRRVCCPPAQRTIIQGWVERSETQPTFNCKCLTGHDITPETTTR